MCTFGGLAPGAVETEGRTICNLHFDNLCCLRPTVAIHQMCARLCEHGLPQSVFQFFNLSLWQRTQTACHENGLCCMSRISPGCLYPDSCCQHSQLQHQASMVHTPVHSTHALIPIHFSHKCRLPSANCSH